MTLSLVNNSMAIIPYVSIQEFIENVVKREVITEAIRILDKIEKLHPNRLSFYDIKSDKIIWPNESEFNLRLKEISERRFV